MKKQKQIWHIHAMEQGILFSLKKKKESLTHTITRMNFEDITVSEINQSQKDTYGMIPLIGGTWRVNSQRQKVEWLLSRARYLSTSGWCSLKSSGFPGSS